MLLGPEEKLHFFYYVFIVNFVLFFVSCFKTRSLSVLCDDSAMRILHALCLLLLTIFLEHVLYICFFFLFNFCLFSHTIYPKVTFNLEEIWFFFLKKKNISHRASTPDKELIMGSYGMLRMLPGLPQERSLNWLSNTRWAHWNRKHTGSVMWTEQVVFCIWHSGVGGVCITLVEERLWVWGKSQGTWEGLEGKAKWCRFKK